MDFDDNCCVVVICHLLCVIIIIIIIIYRRLAFLHKISVLDNIVLQTVLMCSSPRF